jgi:hypothetical protein
MDGKRGVTALAPLAECGFETSDLKVAISR